MIFKIDRVGDRAWYDNRQRFHRDDGPAYECNNGAKLWYKDGQLHRMDGPAIEGPMNEKEWRVNGNRLTEEQFNRFVKQ